jgi:hypothetical protein
MRIILDENIPKPLKSWLVGHETTTVQRADWAGKSNGELIAKIDPHFDLFITADKNLRYQQNLRNRQIAILELPTNRWSHLVPLRKAVLDEIAVIRQGEYRIVDF